MQSTMENNNTLPTALCNEIESVLGNSLPTGDDDYFPETNKIANITIDYMGRFAKFTQEPTNTWQYIGDDNWVNNDTGDFYTTPELIELFFKSIKK